MTLHIQYRDGRYDYVDGWKLDELISRDQVKRFYRSSEDRWVDVDLDIVRGKIQFYRHQEQRWVNLDVEDQRAWEMSTHDGKERRYRRNPR